MLFRLGFEPTLTPRWERNQSRTFLQSDFKNGAWLKLTSRSRWWKTQLLEASPITLMSHIGNVVSNAAINLSEISSYSSFKQVSKLTIDRRHLLHVKKHNGMLTRASPKQSCLVMRWILNSQLEAPSSCSFQRDTKPVNDLSYLQGERGCNLIMTQLEHYSWDSPYNPEVNSFIAFLENCFETYEGLS